MPPFESYDIWPTGDPVEDQKQFNGVATAITARPLGSGATIHIRDNAKTLVLNNSAGKSTHSFRHPVFIRGEHPNCIVKLNGVQWNWGGPTSPMREPTAVAFAGIEAGNGVFKQPQAGYLQRGDYIAIWADDVIQGIDAHMAGGTQSPYEIHRVAYISGETVVLARPVVDTFSVGSKLFKLPLLRGGGIADLQFTTDSDNDGTNITRTSLDIRRTHGFLIENVNHMENGIGSTIIDQSVKARVQGFHGTNTLNNFLDYGLIVGIVDGLIFSDSFWEGSRHVVTTGGPNLGTRRYGTPTGVVIKNVHCSIAGDGKNSYYCFDTHSEGYGIRFEFCSVNLSGNLQHFGFHSRSRKTQFVHCRVKGNKDSLHTGFILRGAGAEIQHCTIEDVWIGINVAAGIRGGAHGGHRFISNSISNASSTAIHSLIGANDLLIAFNHIQNSGWKNNAGTPFIPRTLLNLQGGTRHQVLYNDLRKGVNEYAIHAGGKAGSNLPFLSPEDVTIIGNQMQGYGKNHCGIGKGPDPANPNDRTNPADLALWNTRVAAQNYL